MSAEEAGEVVGAQLSGGDGATDLLKLGDVVDGVEPLDVLGLDVVQAQGVQAVAAQVGIVAQVGEELGRGGTPAGLADHVADLAVDLVAGPAVAEDAA